MADLPHHSIPASGLRSALKRSISSSTSPTLGAVSGVSGSFNDGAANPKHEGGALLDSIGLSDTGMLDKSNNCSHATRIHSGSSGRGHSGYLPKVSFDTFVNPSAPMFSYTLQAKSKGYRRTRSTRVFLCAASPDESGSKALEWVMESLVQDSDELIVFRGFDTDELVKDQDAVREGTHELLGQVERQNTEFEPGRKLSIIVEFVAGKVSQSIDRLIALYKPDSLIVGTRGFRGMKVLGASFGGMGSISKYCLSHSPVPVIVVNPEHKVRKMLSKRRLDPKRGTHFEEVGQNAGSFGSISPSATRQ